jgi:Glycosyltransferase family 87
VTAALETPRLARTALPIVAIIVFAGMVTATVLVAGDTLGFDFLAYHLAAARLLNGGPVYDLAFAISGGFGLFYYPPTFVPLVLPFGLLAATPAVWAWTVVLLGAFLIGVAVMPVSTTVRWWIILLAGLSWPFILGVKLGQVGSLLFLAFAIGWRWLDDPLRLGLSGALGAAIKLQPGLIFLWALLTGRYRAVVVGAVALLALAAAATLLAGVGVWADFFTIARRVGDPIATPHNYTPGAIAFQLGMNADAALGVEVLSAVLVLIAVVAAARLATSEASYLVAVIASQLLSPIIWDHYAMLLLLPVAYLLSAGRWWALLIPLVTAVPLLGITPPIVYPLAFWTALVAVFVVGVRARAQEPGRAQEPAGPQEPGRTQEPAG